MMGCEAEEHNSIPKLPLFSVPAMQQMESPERPGMLTPPLQQASASVPFRWEQEPGKPRLCNALVTFSNPTDKCLELPPRMLVPSASLTSTTLLQGQGPNYVSSYRFKSPSFRMGNGNRYSCYGSFGGGGGGSDRGLLGAMVLIKGGGMKESWWFGSWRKTTLSRGKSRVWTTIREGMKQVVPWRSKKLKKDGSGLRL